MEANTAQKKLFIKQYSAIATSKNFDEIFLFEKYHVSGCGYLDKMETDIGNMYNWFFLPDTQPLF